MSRSQDPPRWAERLLLLAMPGESGTALAGDLDEEFRALAASDPRGARRWYLRQVRGAVRAAALQRLRAAVRRRPSHATKRGEQVWTKLGQEARQVSRSLARSGGFTTTAILTLALGLAANTAVFAVLNGVILEPLPYSDSARLYAVWHSAEGIGVERVGLSNPLLERYREDVPAFESLGLYAQEEVTLTTFEVPERITTARVSTDLLPTLGAVPSLGRPFTPADEAPDAERVALLSDGFWRERYGATEDALGSRITLNGVDVTVVGVMARDFSFPDPAVRVWQPIVVHPGRGGVTSFVHQALARLAPGATEESAERQMTAVIERLPEWYPSEVTAQLVEEVRLAGHLTPLKADVIGAVANRLWILLVTVVVVLLIACANVANLVVVRFEGRRREVALRRVLGADTAHLVRMFVTETVLVTAAAAALGLAAAWAFVRVLVRLGPAGVPRLHEIGISLPVLGHALLMSGVVIVFLSLLPLWTHGRTAMVETLGDGGRGMTTGRRRLAVRHGLIVAQAALATVLVVGSGLLLRSYLTLRSVDPGFDARGVMTFAVSLPPGEYSSGESIEQLQRLLRDGVSEMTGVESVGAVNALPLTGSVVGSGLFLEGRGDDVPLIHDMRVVLPGYFEALGIPLVRGRAFDDTDSSEGLDVVVVSESFAREHWGTADVLGRRLKSAQTGRDGPEPWSEIVGVVGDVRSAGLAQDVVSTVYWPSINAMGVSSVRGVYAVRSSLPTEVLLSGVRSALAELDPKLPVSQVRPLSAVLADSMARETFTALLLAVAAALSLALGAVGVYSVISYTYAQRAGEIGIRMALGAESGSVVRMVLRQSVLVTGAGVVLGLALSAATGRLLEAVLYGVSWYDPLTMTVVPLLLLAVGVGASAAPALRAGRVDPAVTLRSQ